MSSDDAIYAQNKLKVQKIQIKYYLRYYNVSLQMHEHVHSYQSHGWFRVLFNLAKGFTWVLILMEKLDKSKI